MYLQPWDNSTPSPLDETVDVLATLDRVSDEPQRVGDRRLGAGIQVLLVAQVKVAFLLHSRVQLGLNLMTGVNIQH